MESFFYPLDTIKNWNYLYKSKGLIQYHFILPKKFSKKGLKQILKIISSSDHIPFLAVLKFHGKVNQNYLSFPIEGYSLSLDFKIKKGLFDFLNQLDKNVVKYKGRIYLTKDARVSKDIFQKGYPKIDDFRRYRINNNMKMKFQSLQSNRLDI
ncbi:hypothetical protein N9600_05730 [Flavobacteriaceae bacterium]|nr:hypothetical protein [Flavobacteriaceae bacterium]